MKGNYKKSKLTKKQLPKQVNDWFSNVAKSLGYASADIIQEVMPATYEFFESNVSTYNTIIEDLRDNAVNERILDKTFSQVSPMIKLTTLGLENALEDIKTGNFYNKQRDLELTLKHNQMAEDEMFNFDDEDFSFGTDFDDVGDDDIIIDEGDSETIIKPVRVFNRNINQAPNMAPVAKAITDNEVNTSIATIETIHGFAKQERAFEVQRLMRETEFNNNLFGAMGAINENLSQIISIKTDNEAKYISAAISFFGEQIDISKQLLDVQKGDDRTPEQIKDDDRAKNTEYKEDIFLSEGGIDLSAYFKNIKQNIRHLDEFETFFDMSDMIFDSDEEDLERNITQPLKFIPKMIIRSFIPKAVEQSLKMVDDSFKTFTGAFVSKLNSMGETEGDDFFDTIKSFVGRIFGYHQEAKREASLGEYERGAVPFDGITRRTIVDVIPTYLRRIESAITNTNERVYDYDTGKFIDIEKMINKSRDAEREAEVYGQSDVMIYINRALSQMQLDQEDEKSFRAELFEYFKAMNDRRGMINPFTRFNKDGEEIDELDEHGLFVDSFNRDLFRRLLRNLDKPTLMSMVGENIFKTIDRKNKFYEQITADPTLHGYKYAHDDSFIKDDYDEDSQGRLVRRNTFAMLDEYGQNNLGYLRDIRSILLHGVKVFIQGNEDVTRGDRGPDTFYDDFRNRIDAEETTRRANERRRNERQRSTIRSGNSRDITSILDMDDDELRELIDYRSFDDDETGGFLNEILADDDNAEGGNAFTRFKRKIRRGLVKLTDKPSKQINDFLYRMIFGSEEDNSEGVSSYLDYTRTKLSAFHSWAINNVYEPVKDSLIGPEGIITKLKDSKFFKAITAKKNILIDKILGEKDELGNRSGGLLSTFRNKTVDFFKSIGHYFTGNEYTDSEGQVVPENNEAVFRQIKTSVQDTFKRGKNFLLGDGEEEGILKKTYTKFMDGLDIFKESMFGKATLAGYNDDKRKTMSEFAEDIKARLPKALGRGLMLGAGKAILFSKAGLLGSIFLPGGPIGAVIAGTAASLLMESDKFKDWLFGAKDPEDPDKRLGGFIPKNLQDLYTENKMQIKIGGLVGAGFGLLPSFFLPGGPLTGALLGITAGLVSKSDAFQEFLYGENFKDGDKKLMNGAIGKAYGKAKGWLDEQGVDFKLATFLGGIGATAGAFGLLPSFFLPGGPIGGALLGLAGGIAASSSKFQTWFFGEKGWDGKRSGGLVDKFRTWFDIEIVDSIRATVKTWNMKISDFLYDNIAEPFLSALDPMKRIVVDTIDGIKGLFKRGWDRINESVINVFKDNVVKPFGESLNKFIVNPLKKFLNKSFSILGKIVGGVISAPFRLLGMLGKRADKKASTDEEKEARRKYHEAADARAEKRAQRREKIQAEIDEIKENQKRDREYFRRDGRFRNEQAKEKWETEQREKQLWYQQHTSETITEANEKLENIDRAILNIEGTGPKILSAIEDKLLSELRELRRTIAEDLIRFKEKGYGDTTNLRNQDFSHLDAEQKQKEHDFKMDQIRKDILNMNRPDANTKFNQYMKDNYPEVKLNMDAATEEAKKYQDPNINKIVDLLRRKGQSHDEGLDRVPYDGYVAELHEGERIVPAGVATTEVDPEIESKKVTILGSISKYTKTAADAVYGQLNGVGSNIHHIRKMLQHMTGLTSSEVEDIRDQNLPEGGFLSRIFGGIKGKLTSPLKAIRDVITAPFRIVKNTITGVVNGIKTIGSKLLSAVGKVANAFLEIPGKVISTTLDVASTVIKGSASILFKGLNLALKGTATVVADVYKGGRFLVSSIAKSFVPALVGAGKLVGSVLHGIGTAGKFAIETVIGLGKGMYTVTRDVLGFGYTLTRDVIKGVAGLTTGMIKTSFNLVKGTVKGIAGGVGAVLRGGAGMLGSALGLTSFGEGYRRKVQDVRLVGGSLDNVVKVESIGKMDTINSISKVDVLEAVQEIRLLDSVNKLNTIVDGIKIINSGGPRVQPRSVDDIIINNINDMNIDDEISKSQSQAQTEQPQASQQGSTKQQYEDQIKAQREAHETMREDDEKRAEAKADFEHASRLTSDYVQEQKRVKKERKLETDYKTETMKDIDSTDRILHKQYQFWDDIFGKNGRLETKLNSLWEWLKKVAPLALAWLKGTGLGRALSSIFGGTGFATAMKNLLTTLTPTFAGLLLDEIDKKSRDERAEQYNLSDREAYLGYGDEDRYAGEDRGYVLNGSRLEARGHVIKNGVRDVLKSDSIQELTKASKNVINNAKPYVQSAVEKGKTAASGIYNKTLGRIFNRAGADVTQTGLSVVQSADILDEAGNVISQGSYTIIDSADEVSKSNKKLFGKFVDLVSEKLKQLVSFVADKLGDTKILSKIDNVVKPFIGKLTSGAGKIIKKYAPKISEFFISTAAGTASYFTIDAAFAVWDMTTGFTKSETANLFGVKPEDVDFRMRTISAALKTATKFSWIGVIYLANEILADVFDLNLLRSLAGLIYSLVADRDDEAKLKDNQAEVEAAWKAYNEEHGTSLSKEAYIDMQAPTVFEKITNNSWTKNFTAAFDKGSAARALGKDTSELTFGDRLKFFAGHNINNIQNLFRSKEDRKTDSEYFGTKTKKGTLPGDAGKGDGEVTERKGIFGSIASAASSLFSKLTGRDNKQELTGHAGMGDGESSELNYQDINDNNAMKGNMDQLSNVNSNIYHIRKMLQYMTGLKNTDVEKISDNKVKGGLLTTLFGVKGTGLNTVSGTSTAIKPMGGSSNALASLLGGQKTITNIVNNTTTTGDPMASIDESFMDDSSDLPPSSSSSSKKSTSTVGKQTLLSKAVDKVKSGINWVKKLFGYAQGTPWIPDTQVALIHEGEMIVPAEHNPLNPENQANYAPLLTNILNNTENKSDVIEESIKEAPGEDAITPYQKHTDSDALELLKQAERSILISGLNVQLVKGSTMTVTGLENVADSITDIFKNYLDTKVTIPGGGIPSIPSDDPEVSIPEGETPSTPSTPEESPGTSTSEESPGTSTPTLDDYSSPSGGESPGTSTPTLEDYSSPSDYSSYSGSDYSGSDYSGSQSYYSSEDLYPLSLSQNEKAKLEVQEDKIRKIHAEDEKRDKERAAGSVTIPGKVKLKETKYTTFADVVNWFKEENEKNKKDPMNKSSQITTKLTGKDIINWLVSDKEKNEKDPMNKKYMSQQRAGVGEQTTVQDVLSAIGKAGGTVAKGSSNVFNAMKDGLVSDAKSAGNFFKDLATKAYKNYTSEDEDVELMLTGLGFKPGTKANHFSRQLFQKSKIGTALYNLLPGADLTYGEGAHAMADSFKTAKTKVLNKIDKNIIQPGKETLTKFGTQVKEDVLEDIEGFKSIGKSMLGSAKKTGNKIKEDVLEDVAGIKTIGKNITGAVKKTGGKIKEGVLEDVEGFKAIGNKVLGSAKKTGQKIAEDFEKDKQQLFEIGAKVREFGKGIGSELKKEYEEDKKHFIEIKNNISEFGKSVGNKITTDFKKDAETFSKGFKNIKNELGEFGSNVSKKITSDFKKDTESFSAGFKKIKDNVVSYGKKVSKQMTEDFKNDSSIVREGFNKLKDFATKDMGEIDKYGKDTSNALQINFSSGFDKIKSGFDLLTDKFSGLADAAAKINPFADDSSGTSPGTKIKNIVNQKTASAKAKATKSKTLNQIAKSKTVSNQTKNVERKVASKTTSSSKSSSSKSSGGIVSKVTNWFKNTFNLGKGADDTEPLSQQVKARNYAFDEEAGRYKLQEEGQEGVIGGATPMIEQGPRIHEVATTDIPPVQHEPVRHRIRQRQGWSRTISESRSLAQQIRPKQYTFSKDENKYDGKDLGKRDGGLKDKGNTHDFPYFSQLDDRWSAAKLIGQSTIGKAGCGPTSAAMVLTHLTGQYITPDTMAKVGAGTLPGYASYNYFPSVASKFKLNYSEIEPTDIAELKSTLRSGKPVILSGFDPSNSSSSPFTNEGHIVVATGIGADRIDINDPRGPAYSGSYNIADVLRGLKKAIVLESTTQTADVGLPSSGVYNDKVKFTGEYTMSGDMPEDDGLDEVLGGANGTSKESGGSSGGQIKLWEKVVGYARAFIGKLQYSYGSNAIDNNGKTTDCSAFTQHVMNRAAGVSVGRSSAAQRSAGSSTSSPQAGDLVVWSGHVGLVSDSNGNMIDAGSGTVPKERSYESNYWRSRQARTFRRVLSDPNKLVSPKVDNYHTGIGFSGVVGSQGGGNLEGGTSEEGAEGTTGESSEPPTPELGVFDQLSNAMSNIVASMYNGKQVDLFNSSGSSESADGETTGGSEESGGGSKLSGSGVGEQIWNYAVGKGASNAAAAGLVGNAYCESTFKPDVVNSIGATGLFQWLGGRKTNLMNRASQQGKSWKDVGTQMDFLWWEMSGGDPYTVSLFNKHTGGWSGFLKYSDPYKAGYDFGKYFERGGYNEKRGQTAKKYYDQYANGSAGKGEDINLADINAFEPGYDPELFADMGPGKEEMGLADINAFEPGFEPELFADMGPSTSTSGVPSKMNGWAYYKQGDPRWQENIGGRRIGPSGCGMASHAMLLTTLFGKVINPVTVGKYAMERGLWPSGMSWAMPGRVAKDFGLNMTAVVEQSGGAANSALSRVKSELKSGKGVILSGRGKSNDLSTPFTSGGHIVLAVGVDGSGNVVINDPRDVKYTKAYTDSGIMDVGVGLRGAWAFAKGSNSKIPSYITTGESFSGGGGLDSNGTTGEGTEGAEGSTESTEPEVPELGVFDQLSNAMTNIVASMYNGKQVDLFASSSSSESSEGESGGTSGEGGSGTKLSGGSVAEQIWNYTVGKGGSNAAAAGLVGNAYCESNFKPDVVNSIGATGLFQWLGGRKTNLMNRAKQQGKSWKDVGTQMDFLWWEMSGGDSYTVSLFNKHTGGWDGWLKYTDPYKAGYDFGKYFERGGYNEKRGQTAKKYYDQFTSGSAGKGEDFNIEDVMTNSTISGAMESLNGANYFSQSDDRWNNVDFGGNLIGETGCGPTSLAMIASNMTGQNITPDVIASAAYEDGVWSDSASWDLFPWFAKQLNLEYSTTTGEDDIGTITDMLNSGQNVIASGILNKSGEGRSPFTQAGHIVPILGVKNNKFVINDPRGNQHSGLYSKDELVNENSKLRAAWGYKRDPKILEKLSQSRFNPDKQFDIPNTDNTQELGAPRKQYNASELYKNAGLGEGKGSLSKVVHTYKPAVEKISKPVEDIDTNLLYETLDVVNKYNYNNGRQDDVAYIKAVLESLNVAVQELKSINQNTRRTAEGVEGIDLSAAGSGNTTSESNNDKVNKLKSQKPSNESSKVKSLDSDEYKLARMIASFKK